MASLNRVIVMGNLGQDPKVRTTGSGKSVGELSVATTLKTGDKEVTEWHRVIVWDKQAENCGKYLAKGQPVLVEGRLATRSYEKDGEKRYVTEIVAERVQFMGSKRREEKAEASGSTDEIPF